jgi:2-polyprenyl-3-methyl-5-hydroxy-6-metoxy-1,4-benzoquinol methylase
MKLILPSREKIVTTTIYDNCPSKYRSRIPFVRYIHLKKFILALKLIEKRNFKNILDAGCGCGIFIPTLQKCGKYVVGIDLLSNLCKVKSKIPGNFVKADICKMPFKDGKFDCIVCLSVLEHVNNLSNALSEIKRCLSKNGKVIFGIPASNLLTNLWLKFDKLKLKTKDKIRLRKYFTHEHMDRKKIYKKIKKEFKIEEIKHLNFPFPLYTLIKCKH